MTAGRDTTIEAAVRAMQLGYQPVPIWGDSKRPYGDSWTHLRWDNEEQVRASFAAYADKGATNLGVLLGEPSGGLIDVDLDHPKALRLRDNFLPPTPMQTGRAGRPRSHRWYRVTGEIPGTKQYRMPDGGMAVEFRSTGGQTLIPPSIWVDKDNKAHTERYRWEGTPWGGKKGPAEIDGRKLAVQVALLGLGAVLLDNWPDKGSRHEAYLALAGGLLRFGNAVHPWWERNIGALITALAEADGDDDGPEARLKEVLGTTLNRLKEGGKAVGFTRLGELIGNDHAEQARRIARTVEQLAGFSPEQMQRIDESTGEILEDVPEHADETLVSTLAPEIRDPMSERISTWAAVDLDPYLSGQIELPQPTVLERSDGKCLMYPGRVNSVFGLSEAGKSWIAMHVCLQEMGKGERVMYIDLEDEPAGTLARMREMGAGDDDIRALFKYVHPESALADMQRNRWGGGSAESDEGRKSGSVFRALLEDFDPTLIVVDGMTSLYGLHGLDTNDAMSTDIIGTWLKRITRNARTTVIVIDHTGKGGGPGSSPIGAHHKIAFVQGTALRCDSITRPMKGGVGTMQLIVFKDRHGAVREISTRHKEQVGAHITLDSREPGVVRLTLDPGDDQSFILGDSAESESKLAQLARAAEAREAVLALFTGPNVEVTTKEVMAATDLVQNEVYEVWNLLQREGILERLGVNKTTRYRLVGEEQHP